MRCLASPLSRLLSRASLDVHHVVSESLIVVLSLRHSLRRDIRALLVGVDLKWDKQLPVMSLAQ